MENKYTYQYLINEVTEDLLKELQLLILSTAEEFRKDRFIVELVSVDEFLVNHIVVDFFADVLRLKEFHKIETINYIKIASYLSYWIYKRKPLYISKQIDKNIIKDKPYLQSINEWFCLFIINSILYDLYKPIFLPVGEKSFFNFQKLLWYNFCYRVVTPQLIELALVGVETIAGYEKKDNPLSY